MRKFLLSVLLALMVVLSWASPVLAIADPDVPPEIGAVYVYEDLLEDGDLGVLVEYYLEYAALPDETVTEAYIVAFIDTDGTTQLSATAPYTYTDSGYGYGLCWIYFDADEVTAASIDDANEALYSVDLLGNPTLVWDDGTPPAVTANITDWIATGEGDPNILLALRIILECDMLELEWSLDMIESTTIGQRLTETGEGYIDNVIPNAREIAPNAFAATTESPLYEDLDYESLGGILYNGTGTATGAPIILDEGNNNVDVTVLGTFTIELAKGTTGTATTDVCTVTGSPVDLVPGTNIITTTTAIGNIVVAIDETDLMTTLSGTVTGTAFDLSSLAALIGLSTLMTSGLVWLLVTILVCWAYAYKSDNASDKGIWLIFNIMFVGGVVLGMLTYIAIALIFIAEAVFFGYIIFFRGANV